MIPQRFPQSNMTFTAPEGREADCQSIQAYRGPSQAATGAMVPSIITCWKPTPEELVKLNLGEPIFLSFWQNSLPPHSLSVGNPWDKAEEVRGKVIGEGVDEASGLVWLICVRSDDETLTVIVQSQKDGQLERQEQESWKWQAEPRCGMDMADVDKADEILKRLISKLEAQP